jgi:PhoPQ-activated pathogenicity-related protein
MQNFTRSGGSIAAAAIALAVLAPAATGAADALSKYVRQEDDSFAWKKLEQREVDGVSAVRLELTSQTWREHVWRHEILIVRPPELRNPDIAFFFVTGDGAVDRQFSLLRTMATRAGAIAVAINRVPNQPLYGGRYEDALIAYTFDQYLKTGDADWPLLFPMVKSAVRGMDAVQAFAQKEVDQRIERFVVGGASKRGWTTWLTGAIDPRVKGIAPMVIDILNMKAQTQWAEQMYGRQSEQISDYTDLNLIARMDEPPMIELRNQVDPYSYRNRYTMPKLLLLGTNDPFWVVDALRHYWDELPGPKLVFQTPNAGHNLAGGREATETAAAFFRGIADREPLPEMTWRFSTNSTSATIEVNVEPPAKVFRLWTATSAIRDFRNAKWSATEVGAGTNAVAKVETPESGFRAYMVEAELAGADGHKHKLSTEARVTPDGPPRENRRRDSSKSAR